jgi:hypothetical protein
MKKCLTFNNFCTIGLNIAKPLHCTCIHQGLSDWTDNMVGGRGKGDCGLGDLKTIKQTTYLLH